MQCQTESRHQRIIKLLQNHLQPSFCELRDESHLHAGHAGAPIDSAETHFRLTISSPLFAGQSRVAQHQTITTLLQAEFASGLHALAIQIQPIPPKAE